MPAEKLIAQGARLAAAMVGGTDDAECERGLRALEELFGQGELSSEAEYNAKAAARRLDSEDRKKSGTRPPKAEEMITIVNSLLNGKANGEPWQWLSTAVGDLTAAMRAIHPEDAHRRNNAVTEWFNYTRAQHVILGIPENMCTIRPQFEAAKARARLGFILVGHVALQARRRELQTRAHKEALARHSRWTVP